MDYSAQYNARGFLSGIDIIDADEASQHRSQLEQAEQQIGPMHYLAKVHTILSSPAILASHPRIGRSDLPADNTHHQQMEG